MLDELFVSIDQKDAARFASFFADDGLFRFGNLPDQQGRDAIAVFVSNFFQNIDALEHRVDESWEVLGGIVCHGVVTYTRKGGSKLTVPFANILHLDDRSIVRYQVFADVSSL